jgi:glycylpeptide N-tetradecanoyltransferase
MEKKDVSVVLKLYNDKMKNYKFYYKFSQEDVMHFLLPKENIVWTYVIEDDSKQVTDFFSMYRLS